MIVRAPQSFSAGYMHHCIVCDARKPQRTLSNIS